MSGVMRGGCVAMAVLLAGPTPAQAIVIRSDTPDAKYRLDPSSFPQLVDLPVEGQGVLIAANWVVTTAHEVEGRQIDAVTIGGVARPVAKVVIHPGYHPPPQTLLTGDAAPLMLFESQNDDIAMIELKEPVTDIPAATLYRGSDEFREMAEMIGKGATGNSSVGEDPHSPHRGDLRHAYSLVLDADGHWMKMEFHRLHDSSPLEGTPGDGDWGGPVLIKVKGQWLLAGLMSHRYVTGNLASSVCCRYDQESYDTRISSYANWIDNTMLGGE